LPDLGPLPELDIFRLQADCGNAPVEGAPLPGALIYKNHNIEPKRIRLALAYARGICQIPAHVLTCEEGVLDAEMSKLSVGPVPDPSNPPNHPDLGDHARESARERNRRRNAAKRKKAKRESAGSNPPGPSQARQPRPPPPDTRLLNRIKFLESLLRAEKGLVQKERLSPGRLMRMSTTLPGNWVRPREGSYHKNDLVNPTP